MTENGRRGRDPDQMHFPNKYFSSKKQFCIYSGQTRDSRAEFPAQTGRTAIANTTARLVGVGCKLACQQKRKREQAERKKKVNESLHFVQQKKTG